MPIPNPFRTPSEPLPNPFLTLYNSDIDPYIFSFILQLERGLQLHQDPIVDPTLFIYLKLFTKINIHTNAESLISPRVQGLGRIGRDILTLKDLET